MEGPKQLIDWGVKEVKDNSSYRCLKKIEYLIDFYLPDIIVVEEPIKGSRRCSRVKELIEDILSLALKKRVKISQVSRPKVKEVFASAGAKTKHDIAELIAEQFAELSLRLPPCRKPWMSEDYRMSIFNAMAFALAFYNYNIK